ncbi:MAG: hypothetical protein HY392_01175, partial [Candidatus Diapherotrites archaeon]|nr:hypothetical protein [Candidatus Diapherotrites archaeon]
MTETSGEFANIWELYGLKSSPFSTSPILVRGGFVPIESFSGRKGELERLKKSFRSVGGSRIFVVGDVGVGKTSLANVARFYANQNSFFTPFKEIGMQENWGANDFILNTIYAIYATLKLLTERPVSDETYQKMKNLVELSNSAIVISAGLNVGVVGANIGKEDKTPQNLSNLALQDFFQEVINEIKENTKRDVIIQYNNLENLREKSIRGIFEDLRDFFQVPNVHFVFVGNLTVLSIFQSMPRFASIIPDTPVIIPELTLEEIKQV